jgi:hypothetical protein
MKSTSSGEGRRGLDYLTEYIWQVLLDFLVGEAQDTNTALCQKFRTFRIMCSLFRIKVNATVHFNSQLMFNAEKVEDELPVRMLSPEFKVR